MFLHALSNIIHTSPEVIISTAVLTYLQQASIDVIVAYSRFQQKQQLYVQRTLCLVMQGLSWAVRLCVKNDGEGSINGIDRRNYHDTDYMNTDNGNNCDDDGIVGLHQNDRNNDNRDNRAHILSNLISANPSTSSLLDEYLDEIIPALLIRTVSRRAQNEEVVVDQAFLMALTEGINGVSVTFDATDDRLVTAYFTLWSELLLPIDRETRAKVSTGRAGTGQVIDYSRSVSIPVYDRLMLEVVKSLRGLDLSYTIGNAPTTNSGSLNSSSQECIYSQDEFNDEARVRVEGMERGEADELGKTMSDNVVIATNFADQDLLLSLVSFFELLVSSHSVSRLIIWFNLLCEECIELSRAHPLVSPIYRLLLCLMTTVMRIPSIASLLQSLPLNEIQHTTVSASSSASQLVHVRSRQERENDLKNSVQSIRTLIFELQSLHVQHFHDELLSTALLTVLSAPSIFVTLETLLSGIEMSFKTGVQVQKAIYALQKAVFSHFPANSSTSDSCLLEQSLTFLLPLLDPYLMVTGVSGLGSKGGQGRSEIVLTSRVGADTIRLKRARALVKQRSSLFRLDEYNSDVANFIPRLEGDTPIEEPLPQGDFSLTSYEDHPTVDEEGDLQRAIIKLLGRLGGRNQRLLKDASRAVEASVSWGSTECLTMRLPMPMIVSSALPSASSSNQRIGNKGVESASSVVSPIHSLTFYLDKLLPRIVELCSTQEQGSDLPDGSGGSGLPSSSSADRQVKIAAAELLHGVMTLMIGTAKHVHTLRSINDQQQESKFATLYSNIFPTALRLSVSSDSVLRQLFHTLIFQIIRWFAGGSSVSSMVHEAESDALLDALLAGLCDSNNTMKLRNQCADGVSELFTWIVKQGSKQEVALNTRIGTLLDRLLVMASHPAESKRLGAAKTFTKIYRIFREETSLVHKFALRILFVLLKGIRLGGSEGTLQECKAASHKYEEIIVRMIGGKDDIATLLKRAEDRIFPHSLEDLVRWLWQGAGSDVFQYRRSCHEAFPVLCPLLSIGNPLPHPNQPQTIIKGYFKTLLTGTGGVASIISVLEGGEDRDGTLMEYSDYYGQNCKDNSNDNRDDEVYSLFDLHTWLTKLSAMIDAYFWVLKSGYISPGDLFQSLVLNDTHAYLYVKREDVVLTAVDVNNDTSRLNKKRKADTLLGDTPTPLHTQRGGPWAVFQHIRNFIRGSLLRLQPHGGGSNSKDATYEDDSQFNTQTSLLHAEVLRRILQFVTAIISPLVPGEILGASRGELGRLLRREGVLGLDLFTLVFHVILHPFQGILFPSDPNDREMTELIPAAAQHLFKLLPLYVEEDNGDMKDTNEDKFFTPASFKIFLNEQMGGAVTRLRALLMGPREVRFNTYDRGQTNLLNIILCFYVFTCIIMYLYIFMNLLVFLYMNIYV